MPSEPRSKKPPSTAPPIVFACAARPFCSKPTRRTTDPQNNRPALAIAKQLGCCEMSVNDWIKRYQQEGLLGLKVKPGRGRKAILSQETDLAAVPCHSRQSPAHQPRQSRTSAGTRQGVLDADLEEVPEKNGCRFKRIRRRLKQKPNPDVYTLKREVLATFEQLSEQGHIDLLYGDESRVSLLPCVPYG